MDASSRGVEGTVKATVIVSVYKDIRALSCILCGLQEQTEKRFELIVSEDCDSPEMRTFIASVRSDFPSVIHLSQENRGFRKTHALNRAVATAHGERLIFVDGDCVPHRRLVEHHLRYAEPNTVCAGRRVQLGPKASHWLRDRPGRIRILQNRLAYLFGAPLLHFDGSRNVEIGLASPLLQSLFAGKRRFILGCNFSCAREDLLAINGFNEDYVHPGVGEDTDLEWRFERIGVRLKSIRFVAPVFHLHHPASWVSHDANLRVLAATQAKNEIVCTNGIRKTPELLAGAKEDQGLIGVGRQLAGGHASIG